MQGDSNETIVDVRELAPRDRHQMIFEVFGNLVPGTAMILVNDHDPKPLRYQFLAEHANTFDWTYLDSGPEVWRVRISKRA